MGSGMGAARAAMAKKRKVKVKVEQRIVTVGWVDEGEEGEAG